MSIILAIRPRFAGLIYEGLKTVELRLTDSVVLGGASGICAFLSEIARQFNDEDHQVHGFDDDSLYNAVKTLECLSCGYYTFGAYHYIAVRVRKYEPAVIA